MKSIKKILFLLILNFVIINLNAQTGLNFQGVARTSNNVILTSQAITLKLSISRVNNDGTKTEEYVETRKVNTNAQGLFTAVIGDTGAISTLGNFATINWKSIPKFLKIEMDAAAGTNFITMGTTQFQYVAYAQFAKSVDAENIVGIVPVTLGGTGVASMASLKTALTLNNVNNTADLNKPISTLTQTALDLKLNAADTSKYTKQKYTDSALVAKQVLIGLKLNATDTSKYTKQTYTDSSLMTKLKISDTAAMLSSRIDRDTLSLSNRINLKANIADVTSSLSLKESASNKSTDVDLGGSASSDVLYPTQKAVKEYVAANNAAGGVVDGGITTIKIADNAVTDAKINTVSGYKVIGNITGNATTATRATYATTAGNITATTNTTLTTLSNLTSVGTLANLTVTNPIEGSITGNATSATKLAIASSINGVPFDGTADITITSVADAGTLTGTTLKPTVIGSSLTSVGTLANLTVTDPIVGSITGNAATATKLATARKINGVAFDGRADISVNADAGTLSGTTLKSTITGSSLTSVGTLDNLTVTNPIVGSITGNAATATSATTAINITATNNNTLTTLSSLTLVGVLSNTTINGTLSGGNTTQSKISGFSANYNEISSSSYTLNSSDNGKLIILSNPTDITLNIPALFKGFNCMVIQGGVGQVILNSSGSTINNRNTYTKTSGQYAILTLVYISDNTIISGGDMSN
jgi:hypothetical protein